MQTQDIGPQFIYHSGILRAQETADVVARILQVKAVEKIAGLLPDDPIEIVLDQLEGWTSDVMLIGHLPYVSVLLATLSEECDEMYFEPATIACLEKVKSEWIVQTVITPETI